MFVYLYFSCMNCGVRRKRPMAPLWSSLKHDRIGRTEKWRFWHRGRQTGQQKYDGTNILKAKLWKLTLTHTSDPNWPTSHQCLTGQALGYLVEDCQLVADVKARRLWSADTATSVTRLMSNIFGDRCFAAAGPQLWNSLPINLRQCHSLEQFKRLLNTFLFSVWSLVTFA